MSIQLVIQLLQEAGVPGTQRCAWRWYDSETEPSAVQMGNLSSFSNIEKAPDTIFLALPTECVVSHSMDLAQGKLKKARGVLRYDIEPSLSSPLDQWHSIELPRLSSDTYELACATHSVVRQWCQWLDETFPESAHYLVSESWLLPRGGQWQDEERCLVTALDWRAWVCHPRNHALLARQIKVDGQPHDPSHCQALSEEKVLRSLSSEQLRKLPNLRQGQYLQRRTMHWLPYASAALLLLAVFLGLVNWQVNAVRAALVEERQRLSRQEVAEFRNLFPGKTRIVNVQKQLTQELAALRQHQVTSTESDQFLPSLGFVASAITDARSPLRLARIKYDQPSSRLTLHLSGESITEIQAFTESLQTDRKQVRLSSARETDEGYAAVIEVSSL